MSKELEELRLQCATAETALDTALEDVRTALTAVAALDAVVARLQAEARDVEFEPVPDRVRAAIDGNLLQRAGYVALRSAEATRRLREIAQGCRDLKGACQQLVQLAAPGEL